MNSGFPASILLFCPAMDVLRSMCCWLCLQAEGGKRAGAVATVMAAVDLARVRLPVHVEGGRAEEEEAVEAAAMTADQQYRASRTTTRVQAGQMIPTAQEFTAESTLLLPQVRSGSEQTNTCIIKRFSPDYQIKSLCSYYKTTCCSALANI